jgi:hypothetical protein
VFFVAKAENLLFYALVAARQLRPVIIYGTVLMLKLLHLDMIFFNYSSSIY